MTKRLLTIIIFAISLTGVGCGENTSSNSANEKGELDQLFSEVMEIHDVAMARMGELHNVKKDLQQEMQKIDSTNAVFDSLTSMIKDLDMADEGMFDWMGEFKDPRGTLSEESAKSYLEGQLEEVNKVAEDIDNSIAGGRAFLKEKGEKDE